MPIPCQCSELGKTEPNPSGDSQISWMCDIHSIQCFPREKLQAGCFLLIALSCASVEEGLTWVKWITFIYPLNCGCSWP